MAEGCGSCAMCCKLMGVDELHKPPTTWCQHAKPGAQPGACQIYAQRPASCAAFQCLWLSTQSRGDQALPMSLRPDHSKVVMLMGGADKDDLVIHENEPRAAMRRHEIVRIINAFIDGGKEVLIICGESRRLLCRDQDRASARIERARAKLADTNMQSEGTTHTCVS